ncbi:sarcosine oxidase subunit delta [Skermanella stibiiresistens SB22]|uniref:Sarcosine oxidase subunit delta n=1 Tax=Skermanella stibiiresistens SB22 TaxID=1385369 RepID=W9H3S9_9PROT|nr:sarcosine oxidase subunit delta [Skermanella stibiiresistens]EWY40850.1 sarcosine oxidase subunit delta [Skermanella stibiiresistens SB22]
MRIPCPYCGTRDAHEFGYLGDATTRRPDGGDPFDQVHIRDNPAGPHEELWYHGAGCRRWLVVSRDTRTHAITGARFAKEPA